MAKNFKKTAIKTEKSEKKFKKVILPSLRGAKRRRNLIKPRVLQSKTCCAVPAKTCYVEC